MVFKKNSRRNSKSTRVEIRMPNFMYNDLKKIQDVYHFKSLSNLIIYIMSGEVYNKMELINKYENVKTYFNNNL